MEGFHTQLNNAFILEEMGATSDGNSILEKRNGGKSEVFGATLEARVNYNRKIQLEGGFTLQKSRYGEPVKWSEELPGTKDYLRTPHAYGYYTLSWTPDIPFKAAFSGIYTSFDADPSLRTGRCPAHPKRIFSLNRPILWG